MTLLVPTIVLATAAIVALVVLVGAVRQARVCGDLDSSTVLTLAMAGLTSVPLVAVAVTGSLTRRLDVFRELVAIRPSWYEPALLLAMLLVWAVAVGLVFRHVTAGAARLHAAGLLVLLVWAVAHLSSGLRNGPVLTPRGGVLLACLLAATVLPRGRGAAVGVAIVGVGLAIASGILPLFRYDVAFVACREHCTPLGASLEGVLPNENLLGLTLVATMPFAYLGFRGAARSWLTLYLAAMAVATTSRTASLAAVVTVAALLVVRPRLDGPRVPLARRSLAWVVLVVALAASVYVVRDQDVTNLNQRPALWQVASSYVRESPWLGYGPERWATLYESSEIPRAAQRSAHNQWLDVLFVAGGVGLVLLVVALLAMVWSAGVARPGIVLGIATIVMLGATEGAWAVATLDFLSFSLVALILTGPVADRTPAVARLPAPAASTSAVRARVRPRSALVGTGR